MVDENTINEVLKHGWAEPPCFIRTPKGTLSPLQLCWEASPAKHTTKVETLPMAEKPTDADKFLLVPEILKASEAVEKDLLDLCYDKLLDGILAGFGIPLAWLSNEQANAYTIPGSYPEPDVIVEQKG